MKIINNQEILLKDELINSINSDTEIFIATSYFSFPAIFEMLPTFVNAKTIHILLDNTNIANENRLAYDEKEYQSYFDLNSKFKAEQVAKFIHDKVEIREGSVGGQKFILTVNEGLTDYYMLVPYDFNLSTLGVLKSKQNMLLTNIVDESNQFFTIFKNAWATSKKEVKNQVLSQIEKAGKIYSPEKLYKFTLNNIFQNKTFDEIAEQRLSKTGFKSSIIWNMLFNFQKDAVLGAIEKIETFGGCIIADSVGLGKTFEALAIMKYYNLRNDRILVLCPKKLRENWLIYSLISDVRNILAKDRMNFDVLNHTDLSRERGISGLINLETINWGNYDLVVIDESHNFRNNNPRKNTVSRYQRLMDDIIKSGVKTKVLMLSATPVNTRMNDIKNQIAFITEQEDEVLHEYGIDSIETSLRVAQQKFNGWLKANRNQTGNRDGLVNTLNGDYFKILDLLTIARSRKHIEKYYDTSDIGKFPERLKPITITSDFDISKAFPQMGEVNMLLNDLDLKFYSPLSFVRDDKRHVYESKYDYTTKTGSVFSQLDRENSLIHLMRVNLLKRLESSVHSFRLTVNTLRKQVNEILERIEKIDNGEYFDNDVDIENLDADDDRLDDLLIGGKIKVLLSDLDLLKFRESLLDDQRKLEELYSMSAVVDAERDAKMSDLLQIIENKIQNPLNSGNRKIIIFSAFADTVKYLYKELSDTLKSKYDVNSALITGSDENKSNMPTTKLDLNSLLINFSPIAKKRDAIFPKEKNEIDILFCTDCISEGQNLQDCDFLVNYDIHWNPVRIIQRFGRIDRIGSKNDKIQLVNFFPNLDLDSYIDLVSRVKGRMQLLDTSATGDENIIDETDSQKQDLDYRKKQLLQLQSQVLDLEDIEGGISITDFTFNDFKIDADRISNEERLTLNALPKSIYSIVENNVEDGKTGVIFCFRDTAEEDTKAKLHSNVLYPYSLCFVAEDQTVFIPSDNPKKCLDFYKKLCSGHIEVLPELLAAFNNQTKSGRYMETYRKLMDLAFAHLKGVDTQVGISSLALPGVSQLSKNEVKHDAELISFLIVK